MILKIRLKKIIITNIVLLFNFPGGFQSKFEQYMQKLFAKNQSNCYFRSLNNTYLSFDVGRTDGKRVVMQPKRYNKKRPGMLREEQEKEMTNTSGQVRKSSHSQSLAVVMLTLL